MKSIPLTVDLGELGEHTLDFNQDFHVDNLDEALLRQASVYDWYDSVYHILKRQVANKHVFLESTSSQRRDEIEKEMKKNSQKVTQKALDAALPNDPEVITVKEQINELEYKLGRVKGHMAALSQHHSNLKELSRRERWRISSTGDSLDDPEEAAISVVKGEKRG
jgi:hypothetical protein